MRSGGASRGCFRTAARSEVAHGETIEGSDAIPKGREPMNEFPGSVACCARSAAGEENGPSLRSGPLCDHERLDVYRVAPGRAAWSSRRLPQGCPPGLNLDDARLHAAGREQLLRIVAMLVRLCRPGSGSGSGTEAPSDLSDGAYSVNA